MERRCAVEWFNGTMCTRWNDFTNGHKIVVQQRLHEGDVTGDLLAKGGFEHLCLPAEFEPERRCTTSIGWTDPRHEVGELLWPQKFSAAQLDALKISLGSYRYAGQYQQRPSPAEGTSACTSKFPRYRWDRKLKGFCPRLSRNPHVSAQHIAVGRQRISSC